MKLKNFGKFHTKNYEIDLFAPVREIAKDIIKMIKADTRNRRRAKRK